jgi:hypothetical protein
MLVRPRVLPTGLGASTGRGDLQLYGYEPAPVSTTGIVGGTPARSALTVVAGNVTHSTDGQIFNNIWFQGIASRRADNIKYNNCWFSNRADCDDTTNSYGGTEYNDCTFEAESPTNSTHEYAIVGYGFKALRCYIRRFKDGVRIRNRGGSVADVWVQQCYGDELLWWANDPSQTDGTHNDVIQIEGGTNFNILGNSLHGFNSQVAPFGEMPGDGQIQSTSVLMYTDNVSDMNGLVNGNWLYGGEVTVNASKTSLSGVDIGTISNNKWGRDFVSNSFNINSNLIYSFPENRYLDNNNFVTPHVAS